MNIFNARIDEKHQEMDEASTHSHYLSRVDETVDFYRKYGDDDRITPIKGRSNLRNLFDDSDIKDRYWFNVAKRYLKIYRS